MSSRRSTPAIELRGPALVPGGTLNDGLFALLDDFSPTAIDEDEGAFRVFFSSSTDRDRAAAALARFVTGAEATLECIEVADGNWAERSQASLRAVEVGDLVIAPPWDLPSTRQAGDERAPIVITILPSTGFGTGHHASTRLALTALQALDLRGRRVIDVGTGSGVLAIAAIRLGAASALAIDSDPDAIESAMVNLGLNAPLAGIEVRHVAIEALRGETGDVVCANLTGTLIARAAEQLIRLVRASGVLVLAGFTAAEEWRVRSAFSGEWQTVGRYDEDGWASLVLRAP
jgi:ribosomal protein L11 methyltransferase